MRERDVARAFLGGGGEVEARAAALDVAVAAGDRRRRMGAPDGRRRAARGAGGRQGRQRECAGCHAQTAGSVARFFAPPIWATAAAREHWGRERLGGRWERRRFDVREATGDSREAAPSVGVSAARAARGPFAPSSASFRRVPGTGTRSITKRDQHRGRGGVVEGGWAALQRAVRERGCERAGAAETLPRALLFRPRTKSTMRHIGRPAHSRAENGDGEEGLSGALETWTSQLDAGVRLCTHSWSC